MKADLRSYLLSLPMEERQYASSAINMGSVPPQAKLVKDREESPKEQKVDRISIKR